MRKTINTLKNYLKYFCLTFYILLVLNGCKDDSTNSNNSGPNSIYRGNWYLTLITDVSSGDTVFVDNIGNFSSDSLILHSNSGEFNFVSKFSGNINN
jgi:hypothetical protein